MYPLFYVVGVVEEFSSVPQYVRDSLARVLEIKFKHSPKNSRLGRSTEKLPKVGMGIGKRTRTEISGTVHQAQVWPIYSTLGGRLRINIVSALLFRAQKTSGLFVINWTMD